MSSRLTLCWFVAGSSQPFSRRYSFSGPDGHAFEVEIRDAADMSYSTIGSQTWNAAPLLSRRLCASPASFFPGLFRPAQLAAPAVVVPKFVSPIVGLETPPYTRPSTPLSTPDRFAHPRRAYRILELGSGTGLVGITVAALLSHLLSRGLIDSDVSIELVLTDYHPSVLSNLSHNVASNAHLLASPQLSVSVEALDWRQPETSNVKGTFDVVLGSDLVYEAKHAWLVSYMVKRFLAVPPPPAPAQSLFGAAPAAAFKGVSFPLTPEPSRPTSPSLDRPGPIDGATADSPEQLFHLMLPLRPTFVEESRAVLEAFGGSFSPKPDAAVLPLHDCGWEDTAPVPKVEERPTVTDGRDLRIVGSDRQAGPVIGQGVDTYRYLCITWA